MIDHSHITRNNSTINGNHNTIIGNNNTIYGNHNTIRGNNNFITGNHNNYDGQNNKATGSHNSNKTKNIISAYNNFNDNYYTSRSINNVNSISNVVVNTGNNNNISNISNKSNIIDMGNNNNINNSALRFEAITNTGSIRNNDISYSFVWGSNTIINTGNNSVIFNLTGTTICDNNIVPKYNDTFNELHIDELNKQFVNLEVCNNLDVKPEYKNYPPISFKKKIKLPTPELNEELINPEDFKIEDICNICMERKINTVIVNCGHACFCVTCSQDYKNKLDPTCPICRKLMKRVIKVY